MFRHLLPALLILGCSDSAPDLPLQDGGATLTDAATSGNPDATMSGSDASTQTDGGTGADGGIDCSSMSEAACTTSGSCEPQICLDCEGDDVFFGCYIAGTEPGCAPIDCPVECITLDEAQCEPLGCTAQYCPDCLGGSYFNGCHGAGGPSIACPSILCAECAGLSEADCITSTMCYPSYDAAADFLSCKEGGLANCDDSQVVCAQPAPLCQATQIPEVLSSCWGNCVRQVDCGR